MNFPKVSRVRCFLKSSKCYYHFQSVSSASFSNLRHCSVANFSDTFHHIFTNTGVHSPSTHSVFVVSPAAPHTKKFSCLIDRKFFSGFASYPHHKNYHKCSGTFKSPSDCIRVVKSPQQSRNMVWITDLDNPKV